MAAPDADTPDDGRGASAAIDGADITDDVITNDIVAQTTGPRRTWLIVMILLVMIDAAISAADGHPSRVILPALCLAALPLLWRRRSARSPRADRSGIRAPGRFD